MDLFDQHLATVVEAEAPLAARLRPRTLDEFMGQNAIVGPGRLLRRAIHADQLSSLIFYGPPGTGKTTLAQIIANTTKAHFIAINAVLAGVKDLREAIALAQEKRKLYNQHTILFVDEVHRFNKSQQDALLPWVENGTIILIGATTENPYFEVNKALVSRSRLFQLKSLEPTDLKQIIAQALADKTRGYGNQAIHIDDDALDHLVNIANGDARTLLNSLELAVSTTEANTAGVISITLAVAEESIQHRAVLYDKEGDAHFDTISAFIKSLRGSDPDAAMYWLARMVYAGEDPRFILRRMLILAGEDVGMADPNAVVVVNACAQAFDRVGLPEGRYPLAQAALYLATCPKSNSIMGFFDALSTVEQAAEADVPAHLRDPNRDKEGFGHGAGYVYPHAYREHWVEQQYLPSSLQGQVFYAPSDQGYEGKIQVKVNRLREAQLAAAIEGISDSIPERLSLSPTDQRTEQWLQRTIGQAGQHVGAIRDRIFAATQLQRHHLVLDLNARSGLLTWEALRQVPEGGVYSCVTTTTEHQALSEQTQALPELLRPTILHGTALELAQQLPADLQFDCIMGRNVLMAAEDKTSMLVAIKQHLHPAGTIVLAEAFAKQAQRLYQLLPQGAIKPKLHKRLAQAEEAIYTTAHNPKTNWDLTDLTDMLQAAQMQSHHSVETRQLSILITENMLDRWFSTTRPDSYRNRIQPTFSDAEQQTIEQTFRRTLLNQTVNWQQSHIIITATHNNYQS
ncbi:AAA family ATPase [filamentous cyanobacterium LEGE 11480]|uniref:Replication-associated recombination protein A n=1 Tax=Romeriopsis navalis LEGE 11480 TaxID=2777977 RepID=A0A928Z5S3_9CYAN|nr:AAA family ATPase [Romeriopsis navalis]MBE9033109.1 AAA family ATPase [Romeriopsis navalis LEGE 11480]